MARTKSGDKFFRVSKRNPKKHLFFIIIFYRISEEFRPVKIEKLVFGYNCPPSTSYFRYDLNLNYRLGDLIKRYSGNKPTLIFCSTRKGSEIAAGVLIKNSPVTLTDEQKTYLNQLSIQIEESKLRPFFQSGIVYHHAGISKQDRNLIEQEFRSGRIPIMLCTSTLAMGINLPAHLVIIKSTQLYADNGGNAEYPESSIFQMIGRAGRPQFDTSGIAIIMTQSQNVVRFYQFIYKYKQI